MKHVWKRILAMFLVATGVVTMVLSGASDISASAKKKSKASDVEIIENAKNAALNALTSRLAEERECVYVYKDFGLSENHYTQKAKMGGTNSDVYVKDMNENWQVNPYSGSSCIKCEVITQTLSWGGWLFLEGYLPAGETIPKLNDGSMPDQGIDLTGADALRFYARGDKGGEVVEFFTAGFGYDGDTGKQTAKYPDSAKKQTLGRVKLTKDWKEYVIPLKGVDMSSIVCGFGYVLNGDMDGNALNTFYLDDIRFTGNIKSLQNAPVLLRSYDTDNIYIQNAAFSYDNALVAMAFMAEGRKKEAKQIVDAFLYAIENDRSLLIKSSYAKVAMKRVRNAYSAGDISASPGWESGARLPGWYDNDAMEFREDRYQVGMSTGNISYTALMFLNYYKLYSGKKYLKAACTIMDWVIKNCSDGGVGFTAGFDGWVEGNPPVVYKFTYKSIEHNIDAYSVFSALYKYTGKKKYKKAAKSAKKFIISMYDEEEHLFRTGTLEDGVTPSKDVVVLDAQVWCSMALGDSFKPYKDALKIVEKMKTKEGGYSFCLENKNGGTWLEGSAFTALMYKELGDEAKYLETMKALADFQLDNGLLPAATVDNLSTGIYLFTGEPWLYSTDAHIAPAAWYIMAVNGFDPYRI